MTARTLLVPALVAAALLSVPPSLVAAPGAADRPPSPAPVLSTRVARDLPPALRALAESGGLPGGLRPSGVEVSASEIRLRLARDDGSSCTIRLGSPGSPDAVARGRWLALLPVPDASCTGAGPAILQHVEASLPADPWIAGNGAPDASPSASTGGSPPNASKPTRTLPVALALASGALGLLLAGIGLGMALGVALRRNPGDPG